MIFIFCFNKYSIKKKKKKQWTTCVYYDGALHSFVLYIHRVYSKVVTGRMVTKLYNFFFYNVFLIRFAVDWPYAFTPISEVADPELGNSCGSAIFHYLALKLNRGDQIQAKFFITDSYYTFFWGEGGILKWCSDTRSFSPFILLPYYQN